MQNALLNSYISPSSSSGSLPSDCSLLQFLQQLNVYSCDSKVDFQLIVYRHSLLRRWRLCRRCVLLPQKAGSPAAQLAHCLRDILDCSLSVQFTAASFITITRPSLLSLLLLFIRPPYCRPGGTSGDEDFWLSGFSLIHRRGSAFGSHRPHGFTWRIWLYYMSFIQVWIGMLQPTATVLRKTWRLKSCPIF